MRPLLVSAVVLGRLGLAAAVLFGGAARQRAGTAGDFPTCSCDCCDVAERRPDEALHGVRVKCSPARGHSAELCGEQCAPPEGEVLLGRLAEGHGLDYQQFCFYECKPSDGVLSFVGAQCLAFDALELARVPDANGNPTDPALLYAGSPQAQYEHPNSALLSKKQKVSSASEPASTAVEFNDAAAKDVKEAIDAVVKGKLRAQTQRKETMEATDRVLKLKEAAEGSNPLAAVQDIQRAAKGSAEAKDVAMHYARRAAALAAAVEVRTWNDAMGTADLQMQRLREAAREAAQQTTPKPWREFAAAAAAEASRPYLQAVQDAQQVAQQWHAAAAEAARSAHEAGEEAEALRQAAVGLQHAGEDDAAAAKVAEAKELDAKAKALLSRARQMVVTSKEAAASANGNYAIAQEAARRAGATATLPPSQL